MGNLFNLFAEINPNIPLHDVTDAYWDIYNFMVSLANEGEEIIRRKQGYIPGLPFSGRCGENVAMNGDYLNSFETRLDEFLRKTYKDYALIKDEAKAALFELYGLGIMLAAKEVPRICQQFGLETSFNMGQVINQAFTNVRIVNAVSKMIKK